MVTQQEITDRQNQLDALRLQAQGIINRGIPQRSFGSSTTVQQQQEAVNQTQKAQAVLVQVQQQQQYLNQVQDQLNHPPSSAPDPYAIARAYIDRGKQPVGESSAVQRAYRKLGGVSGQIAGSKQYQQIQQAKAQGLEPFYIQGQLAGFSDIKNSRSIPLSQVVNIASNSPVELQRFKDAGIIQVNNNPLQPTQAEIILKQSLPESTRYLNYSSSVTTQGQRNGVSVLSGSNNGGYSYTPNNISPLPPSKDVIGTAQRYLTKERFTGNQGEKFAAGFGLVFVSFASSIKNAPNTIKQASKFYYNYQTNPLASLKEIGTQGQAVLDKIGQGVPELGEIIRNEPAYVTGIVVGNIAILKGTDIILSKPLQYLRTPLNLKITPIEKLTLSDAKLATLLQGETPINIGKFSVGTFTNERQAFQATRLDLILNKFNLVKLDVANLDFNAFAKSSTLKASFKGTSFNDLGFAFPRGKVVKYSDASLSFGYTEPFFINNNGEIARPARPSKTGNVELRMFTATEKRVSSKLGIVKGQTYPEEFNINLVRDKLNPVDKAILNRIETISKSLDVKMNLPKETKISFADIQTTDLFKIQKGGKEVSLIPYGRRTRAGRLGGIRELKFSNTFESREFGLKAEEFYNERIGFVDITKPSFRKPRTTDLIKGVSKTYEYNFPSKPEGVNYIATSGRKSSQQFLEQLNKQEFKTKSLNTIQKEIGKAALGFKSRVTPIYQSLPKQSFKMGAFAGLGLYERTESFGISVPKQLNLTSNININKSSFGLANISRDLQKLELGQTQRTTQRETLRELSRDVLRESLKDVQRELLRTTQRQTQRQTQRNVLRTTQRTTLRIGFPTLTPPRNTIKERPFRFKLSKGKMPSISGSLGFKSFVIKGGKKTYLNGILPKGLALKKGELNAINTLRATFGIEATKINTNLKDINFSIPKNIFRGFRIKNGKAIPLTNEFIQRRGTRLNSQGERQAIQIARGLRL